MQQKDTSKFSTTKEHKKASDKKFAKERTPK